MNRDFFLKVACRQALARRMCLFTSVPPSRYHLSFWPHLVYRLPYVSLPYSFQIYHFLGAALHIITLDQVQISEKSLPIQSQLLLSQVLYSVKENLQSRLYTVEIHYKPFPLSFSLPSSFPSVLQGRYSPTCARHCARFQSTKMKKLPRRGLESDDVE